MKQVSSVVFGWSPFEAVDSLGPKVERLSVAFLSTGPVNISVETAAPVVDSCVTVAADPVDCLPD